MPSNQKKKKILPLLSCPHRQKRNILSKYPAGEKNFLFLRIFYLEAEIGNSSVVDPNPDSVDYGSVFKLPHGSGIESINFELRIRIGSLLFMIGSMELPQHWITDKKKAFLNVKILGTVLPHNMYTADLID
jgi:hypothetical protein